MLLNIIILTQTQYYCVQSHCQLSQMKISYPVFLTSCLSSSFSAAVGRGSGGGVSGSEDAAAAGAGAAQRLPEQDQDANRRSARQGEEGAGAEGLSAEGSAGAESKRGAQLCPVSGCVSIGLTVMIVDIDILCLWVSNG